MISISNILNDLLLTESSLEFTDLSNMSKYKKKGRPLKSKKYFVLHHTGGRGSAKDVMNILNNREGGALGVQYIIDEDGKVFMGLPSGTIGAHVSGSNRIGGPSDLSNSNTEGVEIVGGDDSKISLNQCKTALILIKSLGYSKDSVFGHGEIQSNKMPTEGATCKRYVQKYWSTPESELPTEDSEITSQQGKKETASPKSNAVNKKDNKVDLSTINLTQNSYAGEASSNIKMLIDKMKRRGITNPMVQAAILATIGKESGFVPKNEKGYCGTDDGRIVSIFKKRGEKCKNLKCDDEEFFDCVYGKDSGTKLGNTQEGDGFKYRGRGFNQITGRANYRKYGFENNPDELNDPDGASEAMLDFLAKEGSSLNNKFKDVDEAVEFFVTRNAGGKRSSWGESKAKEVLAKFDIKGSSDSTSPSDLPSTDMATTTTNTSTDSGSESGEKKSLMSMFDMGGLDALIALGKGDQEGFKKALGVKTSGIMEETLRIKDIMKKIL